MDMIKDKIRIELNVLPSSSTPSQLLKNTRRGCCLVIYLESIIYGGVVVIGNDPLVFRCLLSSKKIQSFLKEQLNVYATQE